MDYVVRVSGVNMPMWGAEVPASRQRIRCKSPGCDGEAYKKHLCFKHWWHEESNEPKRTGLPTDRTKKQMRDQKRKYRAKKKAERKAQDAKATD
jgi:hypothetical protein